MNKYNCGNCRFGTNHGDGLVSCELLSDLFNETDDCDDYQEERKSETIFKFESKRDIIIYIINICKNAELSEEIYKQMESETDENLKIISYDENYYSFNDTRFNNQFDNLKDAAFESIKSNN